MDLPFFSHDSIVDFLSFCFALNTMFSITKLRRRIIFILHRDLNDSLMAVQFLEMECLDRVKNLSNTGENTTKIDDCAVFKKCYKMVEDTVTFHKKIIEKFSSFFKFIFFSFAFLSGIAIIFSGISFIRDGYLFPLSMLIPTCLFMIFRTVYWIIIKRKTRTMKAEIDRNKITLSAAKQFMDEVINKKYISI